MRSLLLAANTLTPIPSTLIKVDEGGIGPEKETMLIDIFHDTACPWCRIGKKHLFNALKQWQGKVLQSGDAALDQVMLDTTFARQIGITSVPFFIFNNKVSVNGSQSVEVFRQALNQAALLAV